MARGLEGRVGALEQVAGDAKAAEAVRLTDEERVGALLELVAQGQLTYGRCVWGSDGSERYRRVAELLNSAEARRCEEVGDG